MTKTLDLLSDWNKSTWTKLLMERADKLEEENTELKKENERLKGESLDTGIVSFANLDATNKIDLINILEKVGAAHNKKAYHLQRIQTATGADSLDEILEQIKGNTTLLSDPEAATVRIEALTEMLETEERTATESGGILSNVCDILFEDDERALGHGYEGVEDQAHDLIQDCKMHRGEVLRLEKIVEETMEALGIDNYNDCAKAAGNIVTQQDAIQKALARIGGDITGFSPTQTNSPPEQDKNCYKCIHEQKAAYEEPCTKCSPSYGLAGFEPKPTFWAVAAQSAVIRSEDFPPGSNPASVRFRCANCSKELKPEEYCDCQNNRGAEATLEPKKLKRKCVDCEAITDFEGNNLCAHAGDANHFTTDKECFKSTEDRRCRIYWYKDVDSRAQPCLDCLENESKYRPVEMSAASRECSACIHNLKGADQDPCNKCYSVHGRPHYSPTTIKVSDLAEDWQEARKKIANLEKVARSLTAALDRADTELDKSQAAREALGESSSKRLETLEGPSEWAKGIFDSVNLLEEKTADLDERAKELEASMKTILSGKPPEKDGN